eukprot:15434784-Alexandrium_andersonii.AAC.1
MPFFGSRPLGDRGPAAEEGHQMRQGNPVRRRRQVREPDLRVRDGTRAPALDEGAVLLANSATVTPEGHRTTPGEG